MCWQIQGHRCWIKGLPLIKDHLNLAYYTFNNEKQAEQKGHCYTLTVFDTTFDYCKSMSNDPGCIFLLFYVEWRLQRLLCCGLFVYMCVGMRVIQPVNVWESKQLCPFDTSHCCSADQRRNRGCWGGGQSQWSWKAQQLPPLYHQWSNRLRGIEGVCA